MRQNIIIIIIIIIIVVIMLVTFCDKLVPRRRDLYIYTRYKEWILGILRRLRVTSSYDPGINYQYQLNRSSVLSYLAKQNISMTACYNCKCYLRRAKGYILGDAFSFLFTTFSEERKKGEFFLESGSRRAGSLFFVRLLLFSEFREDASLAPKFINN
jgi:hypothetical protein